MIADSHKDPSTFIYLSLKQSNADYTLKLPKYPN